MNDPNEFKEVKPITIAHVINPFTVGRKSDLFLAQPVTFATMKAAREKVLAAVPDIAVELFAACFPEDQKMVPDYFTHLPLLSRSILDLSVDRPAKQPRKLPLLRDILDRLYRQSTADYFIYTNVDIALMPEFYLAVKNFIDQGYDGFSINRRTIGKRYSRLDDIPRMIDAAREGEKHPGYDCFIFKREAYNSYRLGSACIGANWVGRILLANVMAFAEKFQGFEDLCLTFHIGDDRGWLDQKHSGYNQHNEKELLAILPALLAGENTHNRDTLRGFLDYQLELVKAQQQIPSDIVAQNTIDRPLPDKAENIYHTEFRPGASWEQYDRQLLRQDPIFVVGYPRSGTTLVQALISTQDDIVSFYETHFFNRVRKAVVLQDDKLVPACIDELIKLVRQRVAFSTEAEAHIRKLVSTTGLSVKMFFENIVIDNLIDRIDYRQLKNVRWMEKTPGHIMYLEIIFRLYPAAKVICVMRDPEKAIISRRKNFTFNNETGWPIEKHVEKWLDNILEVEKFKKTHPQSVLIVRLEDITRDTEAGMQQICQFLGIPFDKERLVNYRETARDLYYPWETWKDSARQEISPEQALAKHNRLSTADRSRLYDLAGNVMKRYGYYSKLPSIKAIARWAVRKNVRLAKNLARKGRVKYYENVLPLFKIYPGKINLSDQLLNFYGQHRSGWIYAVRCLKELHNPRGLYFDAFIERSFAWNPAFIRPILQPWIGVIHVPPHIPDWFQGSQSNENIFKTEVFQQSLPFCRGLFTLSLYHRLDLEQKLAVPINHLLFPTEPPALKWTWERFQSNPDKKIVQIGWWQRKIHSIFQLPIRPADYEKIFLKINYFDWDYLIRQEREILIQAGTFQDEMYRTARTVDFISNPDYDRLLSENLVFINLYDSSANNTIIECIARNTPILVNPVGGVVEYLGPDYPFYFTNLQEAAQKALDLELIYEAHQYLCHHPFKEKFSGRYFLESFKESDIYRSLL